MLPLSPPEITSNHNSQLLCYIQPAKELTQHSLRKESNDPQLPNEFHVVLE